MAINSMVMNWIIMACGMLLLVYLGIRANKIASSDDEAGFLLGGRSLGPFVMAGTIMATGFSGWVSSALREWSMSSDLPNC